MMHRLVFFDLKVAACPLLTLNKACY